MKTEKYMKMNKAIALSLAVGIVIALSACHNKPEQEEKDGPLVLSDSIMKMITIDTVTNHVLEGNLDLNGEVTYNETQVVPVMPLRTGVLSEVKVKVGDYVEKGQVLAIMRSTEVSEVQGDLREAKAEVAIEKKQLDVAKDLEAKGINSQKEVVEAEQEYNAALAHLNEAEQKLSILGSDETSSEITIKAPIGGYVIERNANIGQVVREDVPEVEPLFLVGQLNDVWVVAHVYETDIDKVKVGDEVDITTIAYPDKVYKGKIEYVASVLDPESKTLEVRVTIPNAHGELKPEMFARVTLNYQQQLQVPSIPNNSIVFDDNKNYAVIYNGRDSISLREVELYPVKTDRTLVKDGLQIGERIISKHQLLVYNAIISK